MFSSGTPHDQVMKKLEQLDHLELQLAEANLALAELRKSDLQHNANISTLIGEMAKLVVASNDTMVTHHGTMLGTLKAQSANRIIRSMNASGSKFQALQKEFPSGSEVDGGVHLATTLCPSTVQNWQSWPPIAMPLVGEYPPEEMFPKTVDSLRKTDHETILRLIAFYNDSFGIRLDDSLEIRQEKLLRWCTL